MSVKSWHDSDEVDSEDECEAYNMLYYNMEKKNESESTATIFENLPTNLEIGSDIEKEETCSNGIIIVSDSDDSVIEKKIIYTNKVYDLQIGTKSDSDDSDYDENNRKLKDFESTSFIFNTNTNFMDKSSNINSFDELNDSIVKPDWSVDNVDMQPKSKFRSRYFDASDTAVCNICSKKGHGQLECTRSGPVCILCGKEGHISNECDDIICHVCFQIDHLAKKCPNKSEFLRVNCKRCGQRGHNEQICPDIWRQYKYTISPGVPIIQKCSSQNKHTVFCANCSRIGHFTDQCARNRMASRFLGPPPIMEIIRYDDIDIYKNCGMKYTNTPVLKSKKVHNDKTEKVDSVIMDMDVTGIIKYNDLQSDTENELNNIESTEKTIGFGDGFIMLSPIAKLKSSDGRRKSEQPNKQPIILCSTPGAKRTEKVPVKINEKIIDSNMPILPESLLKKLFPEETKNVTKISPSLRAKLRKKLKKFLKNGYLPGDSEITQDRMDFWLQEISTGRSLTYSEKKNLLGSVSAALHSISDRVSDVTSDSVVIESESMAVEVSGDDIEVVTSVPESRRKKNKAMRQKKSLQNELKNLQRDNSRLPEPTVEVVDLTGGGSGSGSKNSRRTRKRKYKAATISTRSKEAKIHNVELVDASV